MFRFYNYSKPGRGINKADLEKAGASLYFDIFFRRIWKMIILNIMYLVVSIPAIVISLIISSYFVTALASFAGINIAENATGIFLLNILFSIVFFQVTGSGPASAAKSYVLRKYVKDTHAWVYSDFFENIKSNFKQGICVYIINMLLTATLMFSYISYSYMWKNSLGNILAIIIILTATVFVMMQMYVYQLMSSVELKVKYIYKNALALTIIKLPWNILVMALTLLIMFLVYSIAMRVHLICVLFILALYFVLISFTQIFMTNNVMKKYVIEPSLLLEKENEK